MAMSKRSIYSLDDVKIKQVQSARMKSQYNFTNGCVATDEAKQMNFILIHPSCEVARENTLTSKYLHQGMTHVQLITICFNLASTWMHS